MFKKLSILTLAAALILALCGCSAKETCEYALVCDAPDSCEWVCNIEDESIAVCTGQSMSVKTQDGITATYYVFNFESVKNGDTLVTFTYCPIGGSAILKTHTAAIHTGGGMTITPQE